MLGECMMESNSVVLNNGLNMPAIGLGTWQIADSEAEAVVGQGLRAGYRLLDTAKIYENEAGVGRAIRASNVPREDIFVTTKLWNDDQGYNSVFRAFDESLNKLGLEYVDLYLIHWPVAEKIVDSWRALEEIYASGRAKAIGVSNFSGDDLKVLLASSKVIPMVNQIPLQPFVFAKQNSVLEFCQDHDIKVEAYSPLTHGAKLSDEKLLGIARKYRKTSAQIMLRWVVQHDAVPIPKSSNLGRMTENLAIFDFSLSCEDMTILDGLSDHIFKNYNEYS